MSIVIFFVILLVLVLVHEFGHFFAAKRFGIRVDEFGFGFPPKLFGFRKGETSYTFNLFPIGGFVKIFGENPNEENTNGPDSERSFVNKARWKQAIVLLAGVFANFLLAWALFSYTFISGLPTSIDGRLSDYITEGVNVVIISVASESAAAKAGLQPGDKIISMKTEDDWSGSLTPETIKSFVIGNGDKDIEIGYIRGTEEDGLNFVNVKPATPAPGKDPVIGVSMDTIGVAKLPFFMAIKEGLMLTLSVTKDTVLGIYGLIRDAVQGHGSLESVTGPVGLVGIVGDAYSFGFTYLLSFSAIISINLAVINLLPFPALDGGRLFFLLIEKIKGSRLNQKFFNVANITGFAILILLMLVITYKDITRLF